MRSSFSFVSAILAVLVVPTAAGCGGGNNAEIPTATVAISLGSVQCAQGGKTLAQVERTLTDAAITPLTSSCGSDGLARVALCGAPDGRLALIEIRAAQVSAAVALGFVPMTSIPGAIKTSCA